MRRLVLIAILASTAAPAAASEIFGGVLAHDVDSRITRGGFEDGVDLQLGWRGDRVRALRALGSPSPYAFASVAAGAETHFAAAGLSWRIGDRLFVRPGVGGYPRLDEGAVVRRVCRSGRGRGQGGRGDSQESLTYSDNWALRRLPGSPS